MKNASAVRMHINVNVVFIAYLKIGKCGPKMDTPEIKLRSVPQTFITQLSVQHGVVLPKVVLAKKRPDFK